VLPGVAALNEAWIWTPVVVTDRERELSRQFWQQRKGGRLLPRRGAPLGRKARWWLLVFALAFALALILGR